MNIRRIEIMLYYNIIKRVKKLLKYIIVIKIA